jgi:hypothetical protein
MACTWCVCCVCVCCVCYVLCVVWCVYVQALLNDSLQDSQLSKGNAIYSIVSDSGSLIMMTITLLPVERAFAFLQPYFPESLHEVGLFFVTFVVCLRPWF